MKRLIMVTVVLSPALSSVTFAQSRCPAGIWVCTMDNYQSRMSEIVSDGARDHFSSSSTYQSGVEAVRDRVQGGRGDRAGLFGMRHRRLAKRHGPSVRRWIRNSMKCGENFVLVKLAGSDGGA